MTRADVRYELQVQRCQVPGVHDLSPPKRGNQVANARLNAPVEHGGISGRVQLGGPGTSFDFARPGEGGAWDIVEGLACYGFAGGVVCVLLLSMVDELRWMMPWVVSSHTTYK